jgi:hypothetical protein
MNEKFKLVLFVLSIVGGMYCAYMWGYNSRANDAEHRILGYDDQSEECFTRDEVDYFIYGKL